MKKTIGTYTVKLDTNSNLITISKNNETVYGKVVAPHDSGSFFNKMCTAVQTKVDKS